MATDGPPPAGKPAGNPFSLTPGTWAGVSTRGSWHLPLINGVAAAAIIAAIGFRLWEAHLPPYAVQQEFILIGLGVVFAVVAVAVRASRFSADVRIQVLLIVVSAVLTVLVLGVAGPWLGDDLPPLAAATFATILLHFELGPTRGISPISSPSRWPAWARCGSTPSPP